MTLNLPGISHLNETSVCVCEQRLNVDTVTASECIESVSSRGHIVQDSINSDQTHRRVKPHRISSVCVCVCVCVWRCLSSNLLLSPSVSSKGQRSLFSLALKNQFIFKNLKLFSDTHTHCQQGHRLISEVSITADDWLLSRKKSPSQRWEFTQSTFFLIYHQTVKRKFCVFK